MILNFQNIEEKISSPNGNRWLKNRIIMKEVYEKLIENLASMTPEEKEKEWEEIKKYNEIGPEVKEIL